MGGGDQSGATMEIRSVPIFLSDQNQGNFKMASVRTMAAQQKSCLFPGHNDHEILEVQVGGIIHQKPKVWFLRDFIAYTLAYHFIYTSLSLLYLLLSFVFNLNSAYIFSVFYPIC